MRGGPQTNFYLVQGRDKKGKPIFQPELAYPTAPGNFYVFNKLEDYVSTIYFDQTVVPMGATIKKEGKKWSYLDHEGKKKELPRSIALDLDGPEDQRQFTYYDTVRDDNGEAVELKWGSNPFGKYALQITKDRRTASPELIHSSGDLMMEERQLVNDLITVLTAPSDELDDCIRQNTDFDLYKVCYDFDKDPDRTDLIQPAERAAYRLYFNLPLNPQELALLPPDVVVAHKLLNKKPLTVAEKKVLIDEGIASRRTGQLKINLEKIRGLEFDTYQYTVMVKKYANHYSVLKERWPELSSIRRALLKDFNNFVIKDQTLFHNYMRELMLKRNNLEKLTQGDAMRILSGMLGN